MASPSVYVLCMTRGPIKLKTFTIWLFKKKFANLCKQFDAHPPRLSVR